MKCNKRFENEFKIQTTKSAEYAISRIQARNLQVYNDFKKHVCMQAQNGPLL